MIASIASPMSRCFLIFIVPASSASKHHEARGLLNDLDRDDPLAPLLKDAGHIGEGAVEEAEASICMLQARALSSTIASGATSKPAR